MKITTRIACIVMLFLAGPWSLAARGAHPLLTEDTGTQGAGHAQLELTHDLSYTKDESTNTREQRINAVLSIGLADNLDVIATLPHERLTDRLAATDATVKGFSDMEIAAKWRFYDEGPLSFALRPGLGLPTGDDDEGLSTGHASPSLFAVMTYADDPWAFHVHLGYTRHIHDGSDERNHIYHASVAAEYRLGESLRLVGDASFESNTARAGHPNVGSMVLGLVYSITRNLDFDLGYRRGLTHPAADSAWLTGLAIRF
jgi:Putative MetA-pathway of phenol degradation